MKTNIILLSFLFFLALVNARHFENRQSDSDDDTSPSNNKPRENGGDRHRRKRYHMSYGYDYQPPANQWVPYRREYDRNQDLLPEIYRLLDEISAFVRRPPPPPQPIYIPYAVPYPVCNCKGSNGKPQVQPQTPNITFENRYPDMIDSNQNWGFVNEDESEEEEGDGSRPLSFTPIQSKRPLTRPAKPLEHGTTQHARAPNTESKKMVPDMCDVFSLSCCNGSEEQQKQCFISAGCVTTYNKGNACDQERLLKIIDSYSKAYAPTH